MLTGEMKETLAISSFNKGELDGYIRKNSARLSDKIKNQIYYHTNCFIDEINKIFLLFLSDNKDLINIFNMNSFKKLYSKIYLEKNIIFSCIYDIYGSLLLNSKNKTYFLNIYSQDEIDYLIKPYLDDITTDFKDDLIEDRVILDYKSPDCLKIPNIENWKSYITTNFIKIIEDKNFYFTLKEI